MDEKALERLFVAVWPPPEVVAVLGAMPRPELRGVRWTAPAQWHVTLAFLGDVVPGDVERLVAALRVGASRAAGCHEARLGPSTARFGHSVVAAPVSGLDALARSVQEAVTAAGVRRPDDVGGPGGAGWERPPFVGHLTVARGKGGRQLPGALVGVRIEARWRVEEVILVRSTLDHDGARYTTLARVPVPL